MNAQVNMKVKMVRTTRAAPDGVTVVDLLAGEEYDLPPKLAMALSRGGEGKLVEQVPKRVEQKAEDAAPDNRAVTSAPANKAAKKVGRR